MFILIITKWLMPALVFIMIIKSDFYVCLSVYYYSPWYNHTGWLGVKHQFTSLFFIFIFYYKLTLSASSVHYYFLL